MRTTVTLDDEQLAQATRLAGPMDRTTLLNEALKAFVEREARGHAAMVNLIGAWPDWAAASPSWHCRRAGARSGLVDPGGCVGMGGSSARR